MSNVIRANIHSVVDVITNSSTTIYTHQDSVKETKELVQEILNIAGITDKTPDDIFYYGVFADEYRYLDQEPDEMPEAHQDEWLEQIQVAVMKGEIPKPRWMQNVENDYEGGNTELVLVPRDERFSKLAKRVKSLLNSIDSEEGYD